jgi:hypothetical protein
MHRLLFLFKAFFLCLLVLTAGCPSEREVRPLDPPAEGGAAGSPTTGGSGEGGSGGDIFDTTSSGGAPMCEGECHLWISALFENLGMFWIGPGEPSACPDTAPAVGAVLHADPLPSPHVCPECSCTPAGCALPEKMHVSAAKCPADGAASIAWDSPAWGGSCTAQGAIPPGLMCSGVPCTQSLTIAAPVVEPCAPVSKGTEAPTDPAWGLTAQQCILSPLSGEGCGGSEACLQPPPKGFSLCLYRWGDDLTAEHCPAEYPRYLVMYADHDDTRACEPCGCSDPTGGDCSAHVKVFGDGACGTQLAAATVSTDEPACVDLPAGIGLGSKSATWLEQSPGSCTATGGPVGNVTPILPLTLCCQEEPPPPAE